MKRCTTETCSITLPLKAEKWQKDRLDKRFELGRKLYNTLLSQKLKKYKGLMNTVEFSGIIKEMDSLFRENQKGSPRYRELSRQRTEILKQNEFTEFGFFKAVQPLYKCYRKNIDSNMARAIAKDVWKSFERYLFGNGKAIHLKKAGQFHVLSGQRARSSIRYSDGKVWFNGLVIPVKMDPRNLYERETLTYRIKFNRILRKWVRNKYQYYVQIVLEGKPAPKRMGDTAELKYPLGKGTVGLYMGISTLAYAADTVFGQIQLAGDPAFEQDRRRLQQKMMRSLRAVNPDGFRSDGIKKRGARLLKSRRYLRMQEQLREWHRRDAEKRKLYQGYLTNRMLELGETFYANKVAFSGLARRRPKDESSAGKRIGGLGGQVRKSAPARLLHTLDRKIKNRGGQGLLMIPQEVLAFCKGSLDIGLPNELYDAFLLKHVKEGTVDMSAVKQSYEKLKEEHEINLHIA